MVGNLVLDQPTNHIQTSTPGSKDQGVFTMAIAMMNVHAVLMQPLDHGQITAPGSKQHGIVTVFRQVIQIRADQVKPLQEVQMAVLGSTGYWIMVLLVFMPTWVEETVARLNTVLVKPFYCWQMAVPDGQHQQGAV